jgi:AcrR family transcriptional regulator
MSPRTRNEVSYEAVLEAIKATARQQMAAEGTAGLSLRAIARELNITAPALYRYYPSRDDLITALIFDAYNAHADAMAQADGTVPQEYYGERLWAVLAAYRAWALQHPTDFQLIYGNPIPGYEAPVEVTLPAARRAFEVVVGILAAALHAGALRLDFDDLPPTVAEHLQQVIDYEGYAVPVQVMYLATVGWTRIHGLVSLELFNQTQPVVGDTEAFFRCEIERFIEASLPAWDHNP